MQLKQSAGVVLLESLLSMLLLAAGVLGLLWSLQQGLRAQRQQLYRHIAMDVAHNMAQHMRMPISTMSTIATNAPTETHTTLAPAASAYVRSWGMQAMAATQDCVSRACTSAEWVMWQMQQAHQALQQLPQGDMAIAPAAGIPNGWSITLAWHDPAETFRTDSAWGAPPCPAEKSCWRLVFRSH